MVYHPWLCSRPTTEQVRSLAAACSLPELVAAVLCGRGFDTPEKAQAFLAEDQPLSDPLQLLGMQQAAERIRAAIDSGEKIAVFGDYDVDGVCATALMYSFLESSGAEVYYKLPNRADEGYGLSMAVVDLIASKGITLIVTVDNGVSAAAEIAHAKEKGVDVVVTDHHLPPEQLPQAAAIVDPQLVGDPSPCKSLSGVGVAFKVACAVEGTPPEEMLDWYGDLVAIGTVADIMSLTGENRVMVRRGVAMLQESQRPGVRALIEAAGLADRALTAENVSFALAPRLNAAGRMDDATASLKLLLSEDEQEAAALAAELDKYNQERQKTEREIVDELAQRIADDPQSAGRRVLVVWGEGYHQGVIGIVASRLVERFGRPAIVFSVDGQEARGSGRSVPGFSLYEAIAACSDLLIRFGGHELAAGMSLETAALPAFADRINAFAAQHHPILAAPPLRADAAVSLAALTTEAVGALTALAPFGSGNPAPLFLLENAVLDAVYPVSDGRHSRLRLRQNGATVYAAMFGVSPAALCYRPGDKVEALLYLSVYEGQSGPMLSARVRALRPAGIGNGYVAGTELYQSFCGGTALDAAQRRALLPSRAEVAGVYREIRGGGLAAEDLCPCFARLAPTDSGRILVALQALTELGLIEKKTVSGALRYVECPVSEKKDLQAAPALAALSG